MKSKELTYSKKNILYNLIVLVFCCGLLCNYFTDVGFDKKNIYEFETVLMDSPKRTGKYNDRIALRIKNYEYEITYLRNKFSKANAEQIITELKLGDTITIGVRIEDFQSYVLKKKKLGFLSVTDIYGLTLKTDNYVYLTLKDNSNYFKQEGDYSLIVVIVVLLSSVILIIFNIPLVTVWKEIHG